MAGRPWIYHDDAIDLCGEFHAPSGKPNGRAVLVVHEADGIGQNVRRRCEMLSALGYAAAAADMHGGGRVLPADEIAPAMDRFRGEPALVRGRVRAAFEALAQETRLPASSIAAIGYCFGGYAVLELARDGVEAGAVASFHGILTTAAPAAAGTIRAPLLVSTGDVDPLVPAHDVLAFESEMRVAGADWHLLTHGQAYHSFTNVAVDGLGDSRMRYDAVADAVSWAALIAFLGLKTGSIGRDR